jgi:threonine dehydrogenase-like Zn-dependent dehydrogenase
MVGYVGVPHGVELPVNDMFFANKGVRGGSAPVRTHIPELLDDVLESRIEPGPVFDAGRRTGRTRPPAGRNIGREEARRSSAPMDVPQPSGRA